MNTKRNKIEYAGPVAKALALSTAALLALSGSVQAQTTVDGARGVSMGGTAAAPAGSGTITGLSINALPSQFNIGWTNQNLSGYVVPAGQFTGIALDGSDVAHANLLPIRGQSFSVANANDVTADVVQINQNGITTGGLSILDRNAVDANGDPVQQAITVDNGALIVGGTTMSAAGPTDTVNILDQTAVDTNNDAVEQALTVNNGELELNGEPVVDVNSLNLPTASDPSDMTRVRVSDNGNFAWISRTEVTFQLWLEVLRWSVQNGYEYDDTTSIMTTVWNGSFYGAMIMDMDADTEPASARFVRPKFIDTATPTGPGMSNGGFDHAVVGVSMIDIMKWTNALSEFVGLTPVYYDHATDREDANIIRTGTPTTPTFDSSIMGYRLPTRAEYEYISRDAPSISALNYDYYGGLNPASRSHAPVASYPAGAPPDGLHDLYGGVYELTSDIVFKLSEGRYYTQSFGFSFFDPITEATKNTSTNFRMHQKQFNLGFRLARN